MATLSPFAMAASAGWFHSVRCLPSMCAPSTPNPRQPTFAGAPHLQVGAAAVDVLLVLHGVGHDEVLVLVVQLARQRRGERVEARILGRLDALVALKAGAGILARGVLPLAGLQWG